MFMGWLKKIWLSAGSEIRPKYKTPPFGGVGYSQEWSFCLSKKIYTDDRVAIEVHVESGFSGVATV